MPDKPNIVVFVAVDEASRSTELAYFFNSFYHTDVYVIPYQPCAHVTFRNIEAYIGAIGSICLYRMAEAEEARIRDDWHNAGRNTDDIICCPGLPAALPMVFFRGQLPMV